MNDSELNAVLEVLKSTPCPVTPAIEERLRRAIQPVPTRWTVVKRVGRVAAAVALISLGIGWGVGSYASSQMVDGDAQLEAALSLEVFQAHASGLALIASAE